MPLIFTSIDLYKVRPFYLANLDGNPHIAYYCNGHCFRSGAQDGALGNFILLMCDLCELLH